MIHKKIICNHVDSDWNGVYRNTTDWKHYIKKNKSPTSNDDNHLIYLYNNQWILKKNEKSCNFKYNSNGVIIDFNNIIDKYCNEIDIKMFLK